MTLQPAAAGGVDMSNVARAVNSPGMRNSAAPVSEMRDGNRVVTAGERSERLRGLANSRWKDLLLYAVVIMFLAYGWQRRGDVYLSPDEGAGYALGIIGGVLMLLLLLYPLRKHVGWMRRFGQVRHWFRMHMMLGIVGPVCVLYHCNFQMGSLNGNVALFSMLIVSTSGLAGRYLYTRIHYGLYGNKADLEHLGSDAAALRQGMHTLFEFAPGLREMLTGLEQKTLRLPHTFIGSLVHLLVISATTRWVEMRAARLIRKAALLIARSQGGDKALIRSLRGSGREYLDIYLTTIRRVAGFTFYERLFGLWHVLHLPLFVMLVISGFIHVYAVQFY
jgi:hypothetical protein